MDQVGIFDPEVLYCTDVDYWLRLLQGGNLFFDQKPVGFYRIHPSASANALAKVTVDDFLRTVDKVVQRGGISLSSKQRNSVKIKSWYKNKARRLLYCFLG